MMRLMIIGENNSEIAKASEIAIERGAKLVHVHTLNAALKALRSGRSADVMLIDVAHDVGEAIRALLAERIYLPIVAYGCSSDPRLAIEAIRAGAKEFLPLPPDPELISAILEAVTDTKHELIFEDPAMARVIALARQYAPADASVLITGESGTGKEVMARYIHQNSRRSKGVFVSVNCAAIPENLLESELFGHEQGAFTGAAARRIGKFEEANGGTLLLDEISEMDVRLQAKLLRVVQEREVDRLGSNKPIKVDIRLIATSNRNLEEAVAAGQFREDLFYRLNVLALHLPPLRDRPADVEAIAGFFARKHANTNGLTQRQLSKEALAKLRSHDWRGNVRELENCIHRSVLLANGDVIDAEAILFSHQTQEKRQRPADGAGLVGRTVADVERDLILDTLNHTSGNRTHAATILGISIRTLRNKLRQYGEEGADIPKAQQELSATAYSGSWR